MTDKEFEEILNDVVSSLKEKGYSPYDQIVGYLEMGSDSYITRHGNAREKIKLLDKEKLRLYLSMIK